MLSGLAPFSAGYAPLVAVESSYLLTQVFNGIVLGMILVIVSLGLTITFGIMGIVNFAHGEFLLVGAYIAWATNELTGHFFLAVLAGVAAAAAVGLAIERFTLRYTYDYDPGLQLLLTFGLAELIRGLVQFFWGRIGKSFSIPAWGGGQIDFVLFTLPTYRVFVVAVSIAAVFTLYLFLTRTDLGLIIRAGTENREMINALGINITKVFLLVFSLGAALAGLAGGLIGPIRSVYPTLGVDFIILAFVVVVIGGIGSFRGTVISGLLVGLLIVLTGVVYSPASRVIIFVFMAVILITRPRGLFGREGVFS